MLSGANAAAIGATLDLRHALALSRNAQTRSKKSSQEAGKAGSF